MATIEIRSIDEYVSFWRKNYAMAFTAGAQILHRGHGKPEYQNLPTICRLGLSPTETLKYEQIQFDLFQEVVGSSNQIGSIKLHPGHTNRTHLNTWFRMTQMRHLEFPSRLQDWTMKKEIALYFAVSNTDHHDVDGHVWFLPSPTGWGKMTAPGDYAERLEKAYRHLNVSEDSMNFLNETDPFNPDPTLMIHYAHAGINWSLQVAERRRAAQGGKFIVCQNNRLFNPLDKQLIGMMMRRVEIPAESKPQILADLKDRGFVPDNVLPAIPDDSAEIIQDLKDRTWAELSG